MSSTASAASFRRAVLPPILALLLPGFHQRRRGQTELGWLCAGTYASALVVGLFSWGTTCGALLVLVAFTVHVLGLGDALRARSFPPFSPTATFASAFTTLSLAYTPLLAIAYALAWPVPQTNPEPQAPSYLANRWAYRHQEPRRGDWICYDGPQGPGRHIGIVRAQQGQRLDLRSDAFWLNDRFLAHSLPGMIAPAPSSAAPLVPAGRLLIQDLDSHPASGSTTTAIFRQVELRQVRGQVWARHWPLRERAWLGSSTGS